jgi:Protein of unknown function (DUF1585)
MDVRARHAIISMLPTTVLAGVALPTLVFAKPVAPRAFCANYADAPECRGREITCSKCHTSTQPVAWNTYGGAVLAELAGAPFETGLASALQGIEDDDSDGDGLTNLEEIELGTDPGDPLSQWMPRPEPEGDGNPRYDIGEFDHDFAYRRVMLLFCGSSPSFDEATAFAALGGDARDEALHEALSTCLGSDYWLDEALRSLANPKIRPVKAYGAATEVVISGVKITIADYEWDFRLWTHVLTGDRDARELLTAQYHVALDDAGAPVVVEGVVANPPGALGGGQMLVPERRAGMLTTQWNLFLNIMFAGIPRVAAGHAYREYLGLNLSLQQGVRPVVGEPLDIDDKGVDAETCAQCHSTLDPLSYAFAYYEGVDINHLDRTGTFRAERPAEHIAAWADEAPSSVVLDQPAADLVAQARLMADSREFQRNLAHVFFVFAVGHEPQVDELDEFDALWTSLPGDGYSANRLLHRLIDTDAFGAP